MKPVFVQAVFLLTAALFGLCGVVNADFVITIEGQAGSPDFSITASGSNIVTTPTSSIGTAFVRVPTNGTWQNPFESTFGDIMNGDPEYLDLIANAGEISLDFAGSVEFSRQHNGLRLVSSNPDQFAITTSGSILPNLAAGDAVALSGTLDFTFGGSDTFDSVWNPGVYKVSPAPDGGSYTVVISTIPEPGTAGLLLITVASLLVWRRRV